MISVPAGQGPVSLGTFTLERRTRVAGRIVDPSDRPVEGVEIWVVPENYAEITQATYQAGPATLSGPDGRFELRERAVGDHEQLRACRKGYTPTEFPAKGPASAEPRIVLTPTVHLAGHVVDAGGEPLSGVTVSAWPTRTRWEGNDLIMPDPPCPFVSSALTGVEGTFTVELGGAGRYEVGAGGAGHLSTRLDTLDVPPGIGWIEDPDGSGSDGERPRRRPGRPPRRGGMDPSLRTQELRHGLQRRGRKLPSGRG
ncbi:MAG: Carboxypeptidase regulatory-like domain [Acidobacteriota bacterium]|nr:Carboxypeptidase regulatory-like domain [Acidobacteriota bacterium]